VVRVAERPRQKHGIVSFPVLTLSGQTNIIEIEKDDPRLSIIDPRVVNFEGD